MVIELAQGTSRISISPWSDKGYVFKSLKMMEQIGDKLASGEVALTSDGQDLSLILEENIIIINYEQKLSDNDLVTYDIVGYIYARKFLENEVQLKFVAAPNKEFSTESVVRKFSDMTIDQIISDIYPGELFIYTKDDKFLEPDVKGQLTDLDQNGLTRLDLCYTLCRSYRKDTVYGLGLEGLIIKDFTREPFEIYGEGDNIPTDSYSVNYFKEMEFKSIIKESSVNIQPRMYGFKYALTRKDFHSDLMDIYQYNTRYLTAMNSTLRLRFSTRFPKFKLGDMVRYTNKHDFNKGSLYIVTWININIDMNKIEFDCELSSCDETKLGVS